MKAFGFGMNSKRMWQHKFFLGIASAVAFWGVWFALCVALAIVGDRGPLDNVEYGFLFSAIVGMVMFIFIRE